MDNSIAAKVLSCKSRETVTEDVIEILTLVSKPDALRTLSLAGSGLRSKRNTPSEVGADNEAVLCKVAAACRVGDCVIKRDEGCKK